jgi:hypothetical protein
MKENTENTLYTKPKDSHEQAQQIKTKTADHSNDVNASKAYKRKKHYAVYSFTTIHSFLLLSTNKDRI